jgi:hypothetical protein
MLSAERFSPLLISTAWYVDVPSPQTDLAQLGIPAIPDRNA